MNPGSGELRQRRALLGAITALLLAAATTLGIRIALGEYADEYQLTATTSRTGFGLDSASAVKIRGVGVGRVDGVRLLDDGLVELTLAIQGDIHIPSSATASIEPVSVFGPKFVDIRPGAGEVGGPFLTDGDSLGTAVAPSELAETLDAVAELLDVVDAEDVGTVLTELARGTDGLGQELGETIDASSEAVDRLARSRPAIEALLRDANALSETLAARSDDLAVLAEDAGPLLDLVARNADPLGELLVSTSELSVRLDDLVRTSSSDLAGVLVGLDGAAGVLAEQLVHLPDFVDGLDTVSDLLSTGIFQWERGPGLWGLLGHGFIDFDPCVFAPRPDCPPRPGYDG